MADENYPDTPYVGEQVQVSKYAGSGISLGHLRNPPVRAVVQAQIDELERQVEERKKLLVALDAEPGVEKILDHMRKMNI